MHEGALGCSRTANCIIAGYSPSFSAARVWPSSLEEAERMREHQEAAGRGVWRKKLGWNRRKNQDTLIRNRME